MRTHAAKAAIINKALGRGAQTLVSIALANNVGVSTLNRWLRESKSSTTSEKRGVGAVGSGARYIHLKALQGLDNVSISAYCRQHGLYPHQIADWETEFMTDSTAVTHHQFKVELRTLQIEIKELKKSILRKDKVLAETVALLILKKKAAHIWGDNEDD